MIIRFKNRYSYTDISIDGAFASHFYDPYRRTWVRPPIKTLDFETGSFSRY